MKRRERKWHYREHERIGAHGVACGLVIHKRVTNDLTKVTCRGCVAALAAVVEKALQRPPSHPLFGDYAATESRVLAAMLDKPYGSIAEALGVPLHGRR